MGDLGSSTISVPRFATHPSNDMSCHHINHPSDSLSSSDHMHTTATHLFVTPPVHHVTCPSINLTVHHTICLPDSPSLSDCMHVSMSHLSKHLLSTTTDHPSATSQFLAFVNGEQSHQAKIFCWAFPAYEILFIASSHVDPPKSGEDTCEACETMGD